ncbi:MAG TPA: hypothetical protein DHN29_17985, partial [Cytophagales bacterium]|nr:hypothetical protein [Cytophagales bacterium]
WGSFFVLFQKTFHRHKKGIRETATKLGCHFLCQQFGENRLTISAIQLPNPSTQTQVKSDNKEKF